MQPSAFDINQRMTCQNSANENGSKSLDSNRFPEHDSTVCDSSRTIALIRFSYSFFLKTALNLSSVAASADADIAACHLKLDRSLSLFISSMGSLLRLAFVPNQATISPESTIRVKRLRETCQILGEK